MPEYRIPPGSWYVAHIHPDGGARAGTPCPCRPPRRGPSTGSGKPGGEVGPLVLAAGVAGAGAGDALLAELDLIALRVNTVLGVIFVPVVERVPPEERCQGIYRVSTNNSGARTCALQNAYDLVGAL